MVTAIATALLSRYCLPGLLIRLVVGFGTSILGLRVVRLGLTRTESFLLGATLRRLSARLSRLLWALGLTRLAFGLGIVALGTTLSWGGWFSFRLGPTAFFLLFLLFLVKSVDGVLIEQVTKR